MTYVRTNWVNDTPPSIDAVNLNKIEQGIYDGQPDQGILLGLAASRPAASTEGLIYIESDGSRIVWRDNGSSWDEIARGEVGIRLAQLAERTAASVVNVPAGGISATDIQAAINELDTEKAPIGEALYSDYIHIRDEKATGVASGGFTQGAWRTRVLTVELDDTGGDAALAGNQITLEAGTYRCLISCPAYHVNQHKTRLRNITDGATELIGTVEYSAAGNNVQGRSFIVGRFTLAAQKVLEVQHYCATTKAADGFGISGGFGVVEVYTEVELWREA